MKIVTDPTINNGHNMLLMERAIFSLNDKKLFEYVLWLQKVQKTPKSFFMYTLEGLRKRSTIEAKKLIWC